MPNTWPVVRCDERTRSKICRFLGNDHWLGPSSSDLVIRLPNVRHTISMSWLFVWLNWFSLRLCHSRSLTFNVSTRFRFNRMERKLDVFWPWSDSSVWRLPHFTDFQHFVCFIWFRWLVLCFAFAVLFISFFGCGVMNTNAYPNRWAMDQLSRIRREYDAALATIMTLSQPIYSNRFLIWVTNEPFGSCFVLRANQVKIASPNCTNAECRSSESVDYIWFLYVERSFTRSMARCAWLRITSNVYSAVDFPFVFSSRFIKIYN